jgi:fibronectin-binding autotransporter adhesin
MPASTALKSALTLALLSAFPAVADTLWWDPNGKTAGTGGAGTWDLGSASWADQASGISGTSVGRTWPAAGASTVAVFGGTGGTVSLKANLTAAELSFASAGYVLDGNGYAMTLGTAVTPGVLRVAPGLSTTLRAPVRSALGNMRAVELRGGGTLVMDRSLTGPDWLDVFDATLALGAGDAAARSLVTLRTPAARLDLGTLSVVEVAALNGDGGTSQSLGDRTLRMTGQNLGYASTASVITLQGSAASRLELGTQQHLSYMLYGIPGQATPSSLGSLLLVDSDLVLRGHEMNLIASDRTALTVQGGSSVQVNTAARLTAAGSARIGSGPGAARVIVNSGGLLELGRLGFGAASAELDLAAGGTARVEGFDPTANQRGTVQFSGGTLELGAQGASSSFAGLLDGASGVLRKLGGGTLSLSNDANTFRGLVSVEAGTLAVSSAALRQSTLTLAGSGRLSATPLNSLIGIGGLAGSFDLDLPGPVVLALGAPGNDDRWQGSFGNGLVAIKKVDAGQQSFLGGSSGSTLKAIWLDAAGGSTVLSGGSFEFNLLAANSERSVQVRGSTSRVSVQDGARVSAQSRVYVNAGQLAISGAGSRLDVRPDASGLGAVVVAEGGALTVADRAVLQAGRLVIGSGDGALGSVVTVNAGARVALGGHLQFDGLDAQLVVDGGAVEALAPWVSAGSGYRGSILLSDGADGTPALTLAASYAPGNALQYPGRIADAGSGPGSLRKVDSRYGLWLSQPLEITGRLIVDGGTVALHGPADLATVTLVTNSARPLYVETLPWGSTLDIGALAGTEELSFSQLTSLRLGAASPRDGRFSGPLRLAGSLEKAGHATQTLAGGGAAAALRVSAGTLALSGPALEVGHLSGTAAGTLRLDGGSLLLDDRGLDSSFAGLLSGASGTLTKRGSGTLSLRNDSNDFQGRVLVQEGLLSASNAALRVATLTLSGSGRLAVTPLGGQIGIGALDGSFDLDLPGDTRLVLGTPGGAAVWQGRLVSAQIDLLKLDANHQTLLGAGPGQAMTMRSFGAGGGTSVFSGGEFRLADAGAGLYASGAATRIEIEAGASVRGPDTMLINAATLALRGPGSRFDGQAVPLAAGSVLDNGARLELSQGAALTTQTLNLLNASQVSVSSGARLDVAGDINFFDPQVALTVDGGAVQAARLHTSSVLAFAGTLRLSDGADGTPALSLAMGDNVNSSFAGRFADAASGPGSLRKFSDASLWLLRPLDITGRLIVDGGQVVPTSAADLARVTLVVNRERPLDVSALPTGSTLRIGALAGAHTLSFAQLTSVELVGEAGRQARFDGRIDLGRGHFSKTGAGTQTLTGSLAAAEGRVRGGILVNNGRIDAPLTVSETGVLKGAGDFAQLTVAAGGVFAPGNSTARVTSGDAFFGAGGVLQIELARADGPAGTGYDQWHVAGVASFEAGLVGAERFSVQLLSLGGSGFSLDQSYRWTVLQADAVSGWRDGELALDIAGFGAPAERFSLQWSAGTGGGQQLDIVYAPVPEPSTVALLLGSLAGMLAWRRRSAA